MIPETNGVKILRSRSISSPNNTIGSETNVTLISQNKYSNDSAEKYKTMLSSKNYSSDSSERYKNAIERYNNEVSSSSSLEINDNKKKENVLSPVNSSKSNDDRPEYKSKMSRNSSSKRNIDCAMKYNNMKSRSTSPKREVGISEVIGRNLLPPIYPIRMDRNERSPASPDLTSIFDFSSFMSETVSTSDTIASVIRKNGLYNNIRNKSEKAEELVDYMSSKGDSIIRESSYREEKGTDIINLWSQISISVVQAVLKSGGNVKDANIAASAVLASSRESYEKGYNPSQTINDAAACALTALVSSGTSPEIATSAIVAVFNLEFDYFKSNRSEKKENSRNKRVHFATEKKPLDNEMSLNQFMQKNTKESTK